MRFLRQNLPPLAVESSVVREMDRRTIQDYGLPGIALMENAGSAAAALAKEMCPEEKPVLVLAGAGNNAGDGFVVARHLSNAGRNVEVVTAIPTAQYKGDAAVNFNVMAKMGIRAVAWDGWPRRKSGWGLIVDALLGTGLSGNLRPPYPAIIDFLNSCGVPVLAIDIPSGLDGDTGQVHTTAAKATLTVTFALPKVGLFVGEGPRLAGEVVLADIGIPKDVYPEGKALSDL